MIFYREPCFLWVSVESRKTQWISSGPKGWLFLSPFIQTSDFCFCHGPKSLWVWIGSPSELRTWKKREVVPKRGPDAMDHLSAIQIRCLFEIRSKIKFELLVRMWRCIRNSYTHEISRYFANRRGGGCVICRLPPLPPSSKTRWIHEQMNKKRK